jgi:hypothetical protein
MVPVALRFFGVGGVSDSSSVKEASGLGLGLVGARLRLIFRGGFGMARWIQRRSAGGQCGYFEWKDKSVGCNLRPISQYAFVLES